MARVGIKAESKLCRPYRGFRFGGGASVRPQRRSYDPSPPAAPRRAHRVVGGGRQAHHHGTTAGSSAWKFVEEWAAQAARLGWSTADLARMPNLTPDRPDKIYLTGVTSGTRTGSLLAPDPPLTDAKFGT